MKEFELKLEEIIIERLKEGGYDNASLKKATKSLISTLSLDKYYSYLQDRYEDYRSDGYHEMASGVHCAIEKFEELKLDTFN